MMAGFNYDDRPGMPGGVPKVWAWIAVDAMGGEGVCGITLSDPTGREQALIPMVCGDERLARGTHREWVLELAKHVTGRTYELREYVRGDTIDRIDS